MRDRLIELLQKRSCFYNKCKGSCCKCDYVPIADVDFDNLADYLLANGVVVSPCKVGNKIYQTDGIRVYESTISEITFTAKKMICVTENIAFDETAIGKSVFLDKKEVQAKLKGGE